MKPHNRAAVGMASTLLSRERLNAVYFAVFTPCMSNSVMLVSIFLLLVSIANPLSVGAVWYHLAEGAITILFVSEVALRLSVMRAGFWESTSNVIEALMCVFCIGVFCLLSFAHRTTRLEHQVLIALRFAAQTLRVIGTARGGSSASIAEGSSFSVYAAGGGTLSARHGAVGDRELDDIV